jgi:hypothetical protein
VAEARLIQNSLDKGKKLPKRFRINNPLVDVKYDYQTKVVAMDEEEALCPNASSSVGRTRKISDISSI